MKKVIVCLLLISSLYADDIMKGQTYYLYLLKDKLGYNGAVFAKKHTKKQWEELFSNNAQSLQKLLNDENAQLQSFTSSPKFQKVAPFLKEFVIHYAKDVKSSPSCN